ncbi:MAG: hypothetical protein ABSC03_00160 [Verrucomicrobiota bacterium]|jgi:hypothetical protein
MSFWSKLFRKTPKPIEPAASQNNNTENRPASPPVAATPAPAVPSPRAGVALDAMIQESINVRTKNRAWKPIYEKLGSSESCIGIWLANARDATDFIFLEAATLDIVRTCKGSLSMEDVSTVSRLIKNGDFTVRPDIMDINSPNAVNLYFRTQIPISREAQSEASEAAARDTTEHADAQNKFPKLQCPGCKRVYSVGVDASIVTMGTVAAHSAAEISLGGGLSGETSIKRPALVGAPRGTPEHQKQLIDASPPIAESIRKSLVAGRKEYWYCRECNQNPPIEFPKSWGREQAA